jgi:hypothetical protein
MEYIKYNHKGGKFNTYPNYFQKINTQVSYSFHAYHDDSMSRIDDMNILKPLYASYSL